MRSAYLSELTRLARADRNVLAMISDNGAIVYDQFRAEFPDQYLNVGISEANMVGMAAGMARQGKIPFAYTIGAFLAYRAFEFILIDVCLQRENVKLVGTGEGCSYGALGPTHHVIFDLAVLRPLPNLTLLSPASPLEVRKCVRAAYDITGPVYIRLGTNKEPEVYGGDYEFAVGKGVELWSGDDVALISTGSIVADTLAAAKLLAGEGISARVINMHSIKPFDGEIVERAARECRAVVAVEEHSVTGGLGSAVAEAIAESGVAVPMKRVGFVDFARGYGTHDEVKALNGLAPTDIVGAVKSALR